MRRGVEFIIYAVFFAVVTEAAHIFLDGDSLDILKATLRGLLFAAMMTTWLVWLDRSKNKADHE
jgi:hypothetical protein